MFLAIVMFFLRLPWFRWRLHLEQARSRQLSRLLPLLLPFVGPRIRWHGIRNRTG